MQSNQDKQSHLTEQMELNHDILNYKPKKERRRFPDAVRELLNFDAC